MRSLVGDDGQRMLPAALSDEDAALLTQRFPFLDQLRRVPSRKKEEEEERRRGERRKKRRKKEEEEEEEKEQKKRMKKEDEDEGGRSRENRTVSESVNDKRDLARLVQGGVYTMPCICCNH